MDITANGVKEVFTVIQKRVNDVINKYVPLEGEHAEENGLFLSMTRFQTILFTVGNYILSIYLTSFQGHLYSSGISLP